MYEFKCREMGMDCDFVTTGMSVEEAKAKALAHAKEIHGDVLASMSAEQMAGMDAQLVAAIKAK
jgi:predicted small metal-binding protein